jgi:hypothetical protein
VQTQFTFLVGIEGQVVSLVYFDRVERKFLGRPLAHRPVPPVGK